MRSLNSIDQDINRCKAQIDACHVPGEPITETSQNIIEGFQQQLDKLHHERTETIRIRNLTVINPEIVPVDETRFLGI